MDYMSLTGKCNLQMDLKIINISCQPGDVIIKFQGKYISDSEFDYHILQNEMQLTAKNNVDINIGEFCLVQDKPYGMWHRGKILDNVNQKFEVALIDQGNVIKVPSSQIASAVGELFTLPPKVVNGIISNLLPLNEKWTSRAINYFSSLVGQQLHGNVKTFLPNQVILLEIPKVVSYAIELSLAKYVDSESFRLLVEIIHKFPANSHCKQMPDLLQQKDICTDVTLVIPDCLPRFQKILDHLRPEFSVNTMEKIKISAAISPDRFYCHVLSWETELSKLTASMCSHYETTVTGASSTLGNFGVLCAAKRKDSLWYRGVIQKLMSYNDVNVWFFDIGSSETVPSSNVQRLQPEFLALPMMAIPCALSWGNDHIKSFQNVQLTLFKEALMGHVVIGHIKDYCSEERLYYLSLYAKEFEFSTDCHLANKQVPFFSPHIFTDFAKPVIDEEYQKLSLPEIATSTEVEYIETVSYKSMKMDLESVHIAYVEYAVNPSHFWIRTDKCQKEYTEMTATIAETYNNCEHMEMVLQDPKPGQLCCARYALDGHYYRAMVTEMPSPQISVYFIDFGNTETIPFYDAKVLLSQFTILPALAMCCSLAYTYPVDDVWSMTSNDFFKTTVNGKALLCHVLGKQKSTYVVEMRLSDSTESSDIATLLVQAGFAELWKVDGQSLDYNTKNSEILGKTKKNIRTRRLLSREAQVSLSALKRKPMEQNSSYCILESKLQKNGVSAVCYKPYIFKPGASMYVKCSHVTSPASFWCQMSESASKLSTLMDEMQKFYSCCNSSYQHGQVACAAKSFSTGKYYRAALVKYVSAHEADVIFIDYGNMERVLISELCEIKPQFLKLEGQAFHCCLSQVFSPPYAHCEWSTNACEDFKSLQLTVDVMKCTVVALYSSGSEGLRNAVNLETRFGNANKILTRKGHLILGKNVPSRHLHTFCYSSFDLEVGSKEDICVTYIYNTGKFYCHLAKNEKIFEKLMTEVGKIGDQVKPVQKPNELCIVRYLEDGNLYRALPYPVNSSLFLAFFVDFGNSQMVRKSEMLSIPEDAVDILFQPMQAIPCYLAGMKESLFPVEAKTWLEKQCVGELLSATVMAKDDEGQLELELSNGNTSINEEVKKLFGIKCIRSREKLNVCEDSITTKNKNGPDSVDFLPINSFHQEINSAHVTKSIEHIKDKNSFSSQKLLKSVDLPEIHLEADTVTKSIDHINDQNSFSSQKLLKSVDLPEIHLEADTVTKSIDHINDQNSFSSQKLLKSVDLPEIHLEADTVTKSIDHINDQNSFSSQKLLKSVDLPEIHLEADTTYLVYASHIDSPSRFFVQLANQEEEIIQIAEELNKMFFQVVKKQDIARGLVVVAQYPDDEAYYRAEIKDLLQDSLHIEFIDYGNVANVDSSCILTLPEKFLTIPRLSVPVFLTGIQKLQNHTEWSKNISKKFSEKVKNEQLSCKFMRKHGLQWEVSITLEGQSLSEELLQSFDCSSNLPAAVTKDNLPKLDLSSSKISNESPKAEATAAKNIYSLRTKTLRPGLIEKVKNIFLSNSETLFVTLVNTFEESELESHIAATVKQVGNRILAKDISEGMVCLAKSKNTRIWLRATVEKLMPSTRKMIVFFVDHGAHEVISMHNARMLSSKVLSIPKQAIVCKYPGIEQIGENVFTAQLKSILQKEVQIIFLEFLESVNAWKVEILVEGLMLLPYLHSVQSSPDQKFDTAKSHSSPYVSSSQIPRKPLKTLEVFHGIVTSFYDPSSFFVQLVDSINLMDTLSKSMEISDDLTSIDSDSLKPGSLCLVKSLVEQEWCRAEIKSINKDFILLHLPDYGIDQIFPYSDYKELKRIPTEMSCLLSLTYHCTLHGVMSKDRNSWSEEAISYCASFVKNHDLMMLPIKSLENNILEVSLYGSGNLALNLVKKGFAKQIEDGVKSGMMYDFPSLRPETTKAELSTCREKLDPSRLNIYEEERWDCPAGFPLQQNGVQEW